MREAPSRAERSHLRTGVHIRRTLNRAGECDLAVETVLLVPIFDLAPGG